MLMKGPNIAIQPLSHTITHKTKVKEDIYAQYNSREFNPLPIPYPGKKQLDITKTVFYKVKSM